MLRIMSGSARSARLVLTAVVLVALVASAQAEPKGEAMLFSERWRDRKRQGLLVGPQGPRCAAFEMS